MPQTPFGDVEKFPISTQEADAFLRTGDGLTPGSVFIPTIETALRVSDFINAGLPVDDGTLFEVMGGVAILNAPGEGEEDDVWPEETDEQKDLEARLDLHYQVRSVLVHLESTEPSEDSPTHTWLRDVYEAFKQSVASNISLPKDIEDALTEEVEYVSDFLDFYKTVAEKEIDNSLWTQHVNEWRAELIEALEHPKVRPLTSPFSREAMRRDIANVPIVLVDPLSALLDSPRRSALGWFKPSERVCYVNTLPSTHYVQKRRNDSASQYHLDLVLEHQIQQITMHELLHSAINSRYKLVGLPELPNSRGLTVDRSWPSLAEEALIEKLSFLCFSIVADEELLKKGKKVMTWDEDASRQIYSANPPELLVSGRERRLRQNIPQTYLARRLLIDTIIDRLDWQAAGLTPKKAGSLLLRAFTQRSRNDGFEAPEHKNDRKKLGQAMAKAAHPGFLNKLLTLEDIVPITVIISLLEDADFDPHNPESVPWVASPREISTSIDNIEFGEGRTRRALAKLENLRDAQESGRLSEDDRRQLKKLIEELKRIKRAPEVINACKALGRVLKQRYGIRQRQASHDDTLYMKIMGPGVAADPTIGVRKFENSTQEADLLLLKNWQETLKAKRG